MESYNLIPAEATGLISVEAIDAGVRPKTTTAAGASK
jgi:hypothetical protein